MLDSETKAEGEALASTPNITPPPPTTTTTVKTAKGSKQAPKPAKQKKTAAFIWEQVSGNGPASICAVTGPDADRIQRYAFSGSHQEHGPCAVKNEQHFQELVQVLVASMMSKWPAKNNTVGCSARFAELSSCVVQTAHSHPGKYVNAKSGAAWLSPPQSCQHSFLTSASAGKGMRWMSAGFTHNPGLSAAGLLFLAMFEMKRGSEKYVTSIAEMLARKDAQAISALMSQGISSEAVAAASDEWERAFENKKAIGANDNQTPGSYLPTLLWPRFAAGKWEYSALTALPSLAVCNALRKMTRIASARESRLPSTSYSVGSGQAQNISVAATHSGGAIPLLVCAPPWTKQDDSKKLMWRASARGGAGLVNKASADLISTLVDSAVAIAQWPNEKRKLKLRSMARKHVSSMLASVLFLREQIGEDPEKVGDIPRGVPDFLRSALAGKGVAKDDRSAWLSLLMSEDVRVAIAKHAQSDQSIYRGALWAMVVREFGVSSPSLDASSQTSTLGEPL